MRIIGWSATALLVAGGTACGGDDEAAGLAAPMKAERAATPEANRAPAIRSVRLDPAAPIDGDRVHAIVSVEDQDGDPIELGFEWRISGRLVPGGEASIELKGVTKRDRIEVKVTASDGRLLSEPARAEARVRNRRPTLVGIAVRPQPEVLPGEELVATAQANDPDGDPIAYSYRWRVNGKLQIDTGDTFETDRLVKGDEIQAFVVASDGSADSDDLASVVVRVGNSHPEIVSVPDGNWTTEGFSYEIQAHDPDSDGPLRYSLKVGPKGMRVDSVLGKVFWQPTPDQTGVHPIEIAVSDALGATSVQIFEITVKAEVEKSAAPVASARR
ncbi:MAG: putative Ig domain-containing protein [Myxococcota bacterium]